MSELLGEDVDFDTAALDWCKNYAQLYREGKIDISDNYIFKSA